VHALEGALPDTVIPDMRAAQDLALQKGLPYQTYIKMLLREAIEKERRSV
jgi:hypothetical protein